MSLITSATLSARSSASTLAAPGTNYTGNMTYYVPSVGACNIPTTAMDHSVAISHTVFDAYNVNNDPNDNPLCGTNITITGLSGELYKAAIVDLCPTCGVADLDLTESLWKLVTNQSTVREGVVRDVSWMYD